MLCPKRMKISARPKSSSCFQYQLGNCKGACKREEDTDLYNKSFRKAFQRYEVKTWPYSDKKIIKEQEESRVDKFSIKNWCLISAKTEFKDEEQNFFQESKIHSNFNYDIYKLIAKKLLSYEA